MPQPRTARLNRRRYLESVKLLKQVISDEKVAVGRRLSAVETLLAIYDRHDKNEERKQKEREREKTPNTPATVPVEDEHTADAAATEKMNRVFDSILKRAESFDRAA